MHHLSDLVLEQHLHGERIPAAAMRHLDTCDDCWRRWEHLHADEGLAPPIRSTLPTSANSSHWRWFAAGIGGSAVVAAMVWLTLLAPRVSASMLELKQEVASLQDELRDLKRTEQQRAREQSARETSRLAPPAAQAESDGVSSISRTEVSELTEAREAKPNGRVATSDEEGTESARTDEERLSRLQTAMNHHTDAVLTRLDRWLDGMVQTSELSEDSAQTIVDLIHYELSEIATLKADAKLGHLTGREAREDWGLLRRETDAALFELLGDEAAVDELRAVTDIKK